MKDERNDILVKVLEEFPDSPTLTLAKKIYKDHPALFSSVENVRSAIRYRRGNIGERSRSTLDNKKYVRENGKAGFKIELPKSVAEPKKPFKLPEGKSLVISDVHVPYHDDKALQLCMDYARSYAPDNIIMNGDIADFFSISRWEKNPEHRNLSRELMLVRQFLQYLRERFPKARLIYKIGNHEERWEKFMWLKAPEISGISDFQIYDLLDFAKYGIEEVGGKQKMKAGKNLTIIHGHEMFNSTAPVNFARTLQTNLGVCAIAGHRHQTSQHAFKTADDKHIHCWSLGCLCDMAPEYAVINRWNHGFATLELHGNTFQVNNLRIIEGNIF
jgi:predicted phosphodiesterase|tara:strand:- start:1030 stop:2019 length:990 start_codon:yes stop_codon:yes gene_type:complete